MNFEFKITSRTFLLCATKVFGYSKENKMIKTSCRSRSKLFFSVFVVFIRKTIWKTSEKLGNSKSRYENARNSTCQWTLQKKLCCLNFHKNAWINFHEAFSELTKYSHTIESKLLKRNSNYGWTNLKKMKSLNVSLNLQVRKQL